MDRIFTENHHVIVPFQVTGDMAVLSDMWNGDPRSDVVSLHGAQRLVFMIITGASLGTAIVTVDGCSDVTPSTTCALTFNVREISNGDIATNQGDMQAYTTLGISNVIYEIEIDAAQLPSCSNVPYEFARMVLTESSGGATEGAIVAILDGLRDAEDILPTQLA